VLGIKSEQHYYFGYFRNGNLSQPGITIMTTASQLVYYLIEAPGKEYYYSSGTVTSNSDIFINFPTYLIIRPHRLDGGIHLVIDSHEVTVIGQNLNSDSSDTFLCLPVTNLCLEKYVYFGISVKGINDFRRSLILIVGTDKNSTMNIMATRPLNIMINRYPVNLTTGMQYPYVIQKLGTIYIESSDDLTGIKILTNQPISVLSGHRCARIPTSISQCDHLVEQVPPTVTWGTVYYTAPLATRKSYSIKILAAYNSTTIDIYCNNVWESHNINESHIINEGESVYKTLSMQEFCAIKSTKPVLVAQFSHGQADDDSKGDPMMTLVPATNQYSNKFQLSTLQSHLNFTHYINVIVLAEYFQCDMIYLISEGVNRSIDTNQWVPIKFNNTPEAYVTQVSISKGVSEVFHSNTSALIATSVYGFANFNAYGHPGGYHTRKACAGCYIYVCHMNLMIMLVYVH